MQRVQPNKSYGQHFLLDDSVVHRTLELMKGKYTGGKILEIGPGTGALTRVIMTEFLDQLQCIEVDERCVQFLNKNYPALKGKIIHQDFLQTPMEELLGNDTMLVGNFPYNISSQIVFKLLDYKMQIPVLIGMFQKEVAHRIASKHGSKEYGILSVLTQLYYDAEIAFDIPPEAFNPPPKVMSSVLVLQRKAAFPEDLDAKLLTRIVKAGFNQRRKMLRNALSGIVPAEHLSDPFFQQRAEQISVEGFIELSRNVKKWLKGMEE